MSRVHTIIPGLVKMSHTNFSRTKHVRKNDAQTHVLDSPIFFNSLKKGKILLSGRGVNSSLITILRF